jgi:DNA-binding CsgD family transcriptional regulator/PAS domain-containing protein
LTQQAKCSATGGLRGQEDEHGLSADVSNAQISYVIGLIYDCALDPACWEVALPQIAALLRCDNAMLNLSAAPEGRIILNVAYNIPGEWVIKSQDYLQDVIALWGGMEFLMSFDLAEPQAVSRRSSAEVISNNKYIIDWAKPRELVDLLMIGVARDQSMLATLGFGRHEREGLVADKDNDVARLLIPHIQRTIAISRLFDVKSAVASSFAAALDAMSAAVLLVDEDLRIIHSNIAAQMLPKDNKSISVANGFVKTESTALWNSLQHAVRLASKQESAIGRRGFGVRLGQQSELPAVVHVLPLKHGDLRSRLIPQAVAAIFVAVSHEPTPLPHEVFVSLYDLTPSEAKLLNIIGQGKSVEYAGMDLGVSKSTIRTHLKHIFAKTGTNRQAELVALTMSLSRV